MQGWVDQCCVKATGRELNLRPVNCRSNALTAEPWVYEENPVNLLFFIKYYIFQYYLTASVNLWLQKQDGAKKEITILDTKRSNAINIGLTALPKPDAIKTAIMKLDNSVINREGIEVSLFVCLDLNIWMQVFLPCLSSQSVDQEMMRSSIIIIHVKCIYYWIRT